MPARLFERTAYQIHFETPHLIVEVYPASDIKCRRRIGYRRALKSPLWIAYLLRQAFDRKLLSGSDDDGAFDDVL